MFARIWQIDVRIFQEPKGVDAMEQTSAIQFKNQLLKLDL
jgi:hypothetical protein